MRKCKLNYKYSPEGFTLIEFLITAAILGVIGTVVLSVLFTTFRASKKADTIVRLRQSGNAVVSQVTKNIRYAKSLDDPNTCIGGVSSSYITITTLENNTKTTFSCDASPAGGTISSNGISLIDVNKEFVSNCVFYCSQETISSPPTVNFSFILYSFTDSGFSEDRAHIPFNTSITFRNYDL